jgi:hypothetical protein
MIRLSNFKVPSILLLEKYDPKEMITSHNEQLSTLSKQASTLESDTKNLQDEAKKLGKSCHFSWFTSIVNFGIKPVKKLEIEIEDDDEETKIAEGRKKSKKKKISDSSDEENNKLERTSEVEEKDEDTGLHNIYTSKRKVSEGKPTF